MYSYSEKLPLCLLWAVCPKPTRVMGGFGGGAFSGSFFGGYFTEMAEKALGEACSWLGAGVRWKLLSTISFVPVFLWVSLSLITPGYSPVWC